MREISEVHFDTDGEVENRRLIERYVLDAVERLPELECCDYAAFMPLSHDVAGVSGVWVTVAGDTEALIDREAENWDALVEEGVVSDWDATEVTESWYENAGERGGELLFRLHHVANQTTRAAFSEFEEPPAPVDSYPDENSEHPIGWWMLLDVVTGHQEYAFDERIDALLYAIQNTCEDIADFESPDRAIHRLDECIRSLEALRTELED